jgi:predicted nucleotidyltransferase
MMIKMKILNKLSEIEKEHNIRILFACESGSRGWQFPSPDSDYDVRFIYARPFDSYLSIAEQNDHFDFPIDDELDINGWDIRKVLQLVRKSNTTPSEWLQSPVVYRQEQKFRDELWTLCRQYFNRRANINHYLGIAGSALSTIGNNGEIKIKKLFYVLRPLLAAKWCSEKNTVAPMSIQPLSSLLPENLQQPVKDLIDLKSTAPEGYIITVDSELRLYIEREIEYCSQIPAESSKMSFPVEPLDAFFRKIITPV